MEILALLIFLLSVVSFSTAEAGYRRDPWGSKTWEVPGRPPHWSAPITEKAPGIRDATSKRRYDRPDWRRHHDGAFYDKRKSRRTIIFRQQYDAPVVINERTVIQNRYVPVLREFSPRSCRGDIVYLRDSDTNELIIHYVSPADNC